MRYAGKAVLVTGGATGIGRATALAFAREGAAVVIGDVNPAAGSTADDIRTAGGRAVFAPTDVADEQQCLALVAACVEAYGRLDAAFNNAGVLAPMVPLHEASLADYERTMAINARGVFLCMKAQLRHMLEAGGGAIVNTASIGRPAQPQEICGMVLHLCSAEASFTNGAIILMDGGQTSI